jgi:hypothetical protein
MDNPETLVTLWILGTGQTERTIKKNGQSRDTGNIVNTRYRAKKKKQIIQHITEN